MWEKEGSGQKKKQTSWVVLANYLDEDVTIRMSVLQET